MSNPFTTPATTTALPSSVLTVEEAAARLRVCERTVYDMIRSGRIEAFKPGAHYRIPEEAMWEALRVRRDREVSRDPMPRPRRSRLRSKVAAIEDRRAS